jgi:uncharacterized protein
MMSDRQTRPAGWQASVPYVTPLAIFLLLTGVADAVPVWRAEIYLVKVLLAGAVLWYWRRSYPELRPSGAGGLVAGVIVGAAVIALWIVIDPWYPQSLAEASGWLSHGLQPLDHTAKLANGYNPWTSAALLSPVVALVCRVLGAVFVIPVAEELFYRAWLLRYAIRDDFQAVALGTFTLGSFVWTVLLFGLSHHEWLAALACAAAFNGLLYWRKDLFACVVAHSVANAGLAYWVITHEAWGFW